MIGTMAETLAGDDDDSDDGGGKRKSATERGAEGY